MSFLAPDIDGQAAQLNLVNKGSMFLKKGQKKAADAIKTGTRQALPYLEEGSGLFDNLLADRQGATDMYYNSLGLNGEDGSDAAFDTYRGTAGYRNALDQFGMDAETIQRLNASAGNLFSGNTGIALNDRARTLQNMGFGDWQDRLAGQDVMPAIAGKYGALTRLGDLFTGQGKDLADVYSQFAPQMAGQLNNKASLIGQQEMMDAQMQQQGISNALGLAGMFTGMLGKGGAFGSGGAFGA